jgi:hypothetical protein
MRCEERIAGASAVAAPQFWDTCLFQFWYTTWGQIKAGARKRVNRALCSSLRREQATGRAFSARPVALGGELDLCNCTHGRRSCQAAMYGFPIDILKKCLDIFSTFRRFIVEKECVFPHIHD